MQKRDKILLCVAPYGVAAYLWFSLANPALLMGQDKNTELENKRGEQAQLKVKLAKLEKQQEQKKNLEHDIAQLRSSVPNNPSFDLLMIDLEKMCLDSGCDLVSVDTPEGEVIKKAQAAEAAAMDAATPKKPAAGAAGAAKPGAAAAATPKPAAASSGKSDEPLEIGLDKLIMQVNVTGDYPSYIKLMRMLENYERVVGVNQISVVLPEPKGDKKVVNPKQLDISFLITAYYLP